MLELIKKTVYNAFDPSEKKWVFLSWFSKDKKLLLSQWVVDTDQPLEKTLESLYKKFIKPKEKLLHYLAVDVVTEIVELEDPNDVWDMDPTEYGMIVVDTDDDTTGILLPNTDWVADMKWAIYAIKEKYGIHGKVTIAAFRTRRVLLKP